MKVSQGWKNEKPQIFLEDIPELEYNCPTSSFPEEDYQIIRSDLFKDENGSTFSVLELHIGAIRFESNIVCSNKDVLPVKQYLFRVYRQSGDLSMLDQTEGSKLCREVATIESAEVLYSILYEENIIKGFIPVDFLSKKIGSEKLKSEYISYHSNTTNLNKDVAELVEYIFGETKNMLSDKIQGELMAEGIIQTPLGNLSLNQIEKAQVILLEIGEILKNTENQMDLREKLESLSKQFFNMIPQTKDSTILGLDQLEEQNDLIQLLKDVLNVGEITGGSLFSSVDLKYRSLRCGIEVVPNDSEEYRNLVRQVEKNGGEKIKIQNVFSVNRAVERSIFQSQISNQQLLFHGSKTGLTFAKFFCSYSSFIFFCFRKSCWHSFQRNSLT